MITVTKTECKILDILICTRNKLLQRTGMKNKLRNDTSLLLLSTLPSQGTESGGIAPHIISRGNTRI
jgi:hypothetical protein